MTKITKTVKKSADFINYKNQPLYALSKKIERFNFIQKKLQHYFDKKILPDCELIPTDSSILIILANSGSLAFHLRSQSEYFLAKFQTDKDLRHIKKLCIKVKPAAIASKTQEHQMAKLSLNTAQTINEIAKTLKDPALKAIMERIATRIITFF